jgi:DNA-binding response OmpR family regulator
MPIVLITGFPGEYTPKDVSTAGADGYFSKPFKNTELVRKLRTLVDKYRSETKMTAPAAPPP